MSEEEQKTPSFTVKDKRRFTEQGELRTEPEGDGSSTAQTEARPEPGRAEQAARDGQTSAERAAQARAAQEAMGPAGEFEVNFAAFVVSLAHQALCQLGEASSPPGYEIPVDQNAARQSIEIIRMLQAKTKGNLDENESLLIENLLHDLQLAFVRSTRS